MTSNTIFKQTKNHIQLRDIIQADDNIIQAGVKNTIAFTEFKDVGANNYLGLASESDFKKIDNKLGIKKLICTNATAQSVYRNNADVVVLSGRFAAFAFAPHRFQHTRVVLIEKKMSKLPFILSGIFRGTVLRKWQAVGTVVLSNQSGTENYLVCVVVDRLKSGHRNYSSPLEPISETFKLLDTKKISYALLRWFSSSDRKDLTEDYDILVADDDFEDLYSLLRAKPGIVPFDIYTVSGAGGTEYNKVPYLPPQKAQELLATVIEKEYFKIPNRLNYFHSLAYHALYHKGYTSGLPSKHSTDTTGTPDHDYVAILTDLAQELGLDVDITLEGIEKYLSLVGWSPTFDTLRKMSINNSWIADHYTADLSGTKETGLGPGLAVFVVRQKALENNFLDTIKQLLIKEGFHILYSDLLSESEKLQARSLIRGGNWGRGPWSISGGEPAVCIVVSDLIPRKLNEYDKVRYPYLDNRRILVKERIRKAYNSTLDKNDQCNILHSSDNSQEALEYVSGVLPHHHDIIVDKFKQMRKDFETPFTVLQNLTGSGRRAKIEVVDYQGEPAIYKKFRPHAKRYASREIMVMKEWGKENNLIPELLEHGEDFFISKKYSHRVTFPFGLMSLSHALQAKDFMKFLYKKNYFWGDSSPFNMCLDGNKKLKIIDFEFTQEYKDKPASLAESFDFVQSPEDKEYDLPGLRLEKGGDDYDNLWKPYTGLSLYSFLHEPLYIQHSRRLLYVLTHIHVSVYKKVVTICKTYLTSALVTFIKKTVHFLDTAIDKIYAAI